RSRPVGVGVCQLLCRVAHDGALISHKRDGTMAPVATNGAQRTACVEDLGQWRVDIIGRLAVPAHLRTTALATSMFQRYNLTSGTDQVEALKKTAAHLAALPKFDEKAVVELPQVAGGK